MQIRSTNGWPVDRSVQARNAAQRRQRLAAKRARRASAPEHQSPLARWLFVRRDHGSLLPSNHTAGQNAAEA
jgi:hypothetical protein